MVKSKNPSMPPLTAWPEAAPSPQEGKLLSISIGKTVISWAIHAGLEDNFVPTLFWSTHPIDDPNQGRGTNCEFLSTYLSDGAREIIFGSKSADPTRQHGIRASAERRVSLLSVYVVSSDDDQLKTLYSVLSEIPCRVYLLKEDDFFTKEQGRYDEMGTYRLAALRAAAAFKGYPALVFDGGAGSTYTAADENGNIMGGGIGPSAQTIMDSLSIIAPGLPHLTLAHVMNELASLTDKDGNVLKSLPLFARTTEENIVTRLCTGISRTGQFVIDNFIHKTGGPKTNDNEDNLDTEHVIHVTGGDDEASLIATLLEPNCPLIRSLPNTASTSSPPSYKVEVKKHMVHYGIASVLKKNAVEFENCATAELDTCLIGQRIAKQFSTTDQDGDHIYRGSISCVHGAGSQLPYGIRFDDGDTENMNAIQLYEAMELYTQVGEKETHAGQSSRERCQPRQPPQGAKILGARAAAIQLATKDKDVKELIERKKHAQNKTPASVAGPSSTPAAAPTANPKPAKDATVQKPSAEGKKRRSTNKTPASGAEPPKQFAKKPKKARPSLKKVDKDYVGDRVAKDFDGEIFFGTVRDSWYDEESKERQWEIKYDDSDEEDVEMQEFIGLVDLYEKEKKNDDKKGV